MTLSTFLKHQWLNFWRSRNANQSFVFKIIIGIFYLLIFLEIAGLGIYLPSLLEESFPAKDPIYLFCSYIIYYFLIGLLVRFQLQELPTLSIQPYLTQNIKRSIMLRFLNVRSIIHFINFLPLFVFIPFTVVDIVPVYGVAVAIAFLMAMFALVINNHFLNMFIKRKSVNSSWWFLGMILFIALIKGLDYFKILSFEQASAKIFIYLLQHAWLCVIPISLAFYTYFISNKYLRSNLYLEELVSERKLKYSKNYSFLDKYGDVGTIIALDLKLIFRNKRPRSLMIMSSLILLYGFIIYPKNLQTDNYYMAFFGAQLITGIFIVNYGQFLFAWQSNHFDGMMSYNINMKQYLKAKFSLFVLVSSMQFLFVSFYGFLNWRVLPIQVAAFLFNIGINSFMIMYLATYNYKYLNISKSASMNRQGTDSSQILQGIIVAFMPTLLFFLFNKFAGFWITIIVISILGIAGLIITPITINWLAGQFQTRKHKILEGFRER